METKICSKCKIEKLVEDFFYHPHTKDNRQSHCKECVSEYKESIKGEYLYLIFESKDIAYVGSCNNIIDRVSSHTNGYSNIREYMLEDNWTEIRVLNIDDIVKSKKERLFVEATLIYELAPKLNKNRSIPSLDNIDREEKLTKFAFDLMDNIDEMFFEYKKNNIE